MDESELSKILGRKGYGIAQGVRSQLGSAIDAEAKRRKLERDAGIEDSDSGEVNDLESNSGNESLGSKKLQVSYSGKVRIRITFYRRRLADYGEECSRAISEKAIIDCLAYAGLIKGDSGKEVWVEDGGQKKVASNEEERTEITILYNGFDYENPWALEIDN